MSRWFEHGVLDGIIRAFHRLAPAQRKEAGDPGLSSLQPPLRAAALGQQFASRTDSPACRSQDCEPVAAASQCGASTT